MTIKQTIAAALVGAVLAGGQAWAHSPLCSCFANDDGTVTCEGGFSDGSAAAGVEVRVEETDGKTLIKGKMNKIGEFTFKKPSVPYRFVFDGGPGHLLRIGEKDIAR